MPLKCGIRRVVIVTGAGHRLGRVYALNLAARGLRVVVNNRRRDVDATGQGSAQRVAREILAPGDEGVAEEADGCDSASGVALVARTLASWGRLDTVVANAGIDQHQAFHKVSIDEFRAIFEVNFLGSLYLLHAAYAHMRANRPGRIVVSTSSADLHGLIAYAASKAALIALMRSIAAEGLSHDVLCNAVAPYAATRMTAAHGDAAFAARMRPEHVAPLVALLVSEQCSLSGQTIVAGDGFRAAFVVEAPGIQYASAATVRPEDMKAHFLEPFPKGDAMTFPDALAAFSHFMQGLGRLTDANH